MNPTDWVSFKRSGYGDWYQRLLDYDASNNLIYVGLGGRGALTSAASWVVFKLGYDGSNNLTSVKTAPENSIWDNRVSLTYA